MLDFMRFITPAAPPPDPNKAAANAIGALDHSADLKREDTKIANQSAQFGQTLQREQSNDQWGKQKDVVGVMDKYLDVLANNPEMAPQYENELRALGVQFHPTEPPAAAPPLLEASPDEPTPAEMQAPKPQAPPANVPPGLSRFMATQAAELPSDEPPGDAEQAASDARVQSIGGTPSPRTPPIDPNVAPPEEIGQALRQPMQPQAFRALQALGMNPMSMIAQSVGGQPAPREEPPTTTGKPTVSPSAKAPDDAAVESALRMQGAAPKLAPFRATWNGIDLGTFDPEAARVAQKRSAEDVAKDYTGGTVEKYRPLIEALTKSGKSPAEIHALMKTLGTPELLKLLGDDAAVTAAGRHAGANPREDLSEYKAGQESVKNVFDEHPDLKDDMKAVRDLPKVIDLLLHPRNGMDSSLAVREMMKAYNSGAFSDKDADAYLHDVSMWERIKSDFYRGVYSQISPEITRSLAAAATHKRDEALNNVGDAYRSLVDANNFERGTAPFHQGRRLAVKQVFSTMPMYNPKDWGDEETPREEPAATPSKPGAPAPKAPTLAGKSAPAPAKKERPAFLR